MTALRAALPIIGFVVIALAAIAFAALPLWRRADQKGRVILMATVALFMLGIGGGTYWMVGRPYIAMRAAKGLNTTDVRGLIPFLTARVRQYPTDSKAWRYLAQVYLAARDPGDGAKALAHVIAIEGKGNPEIDSAYGEALVTDSGGQVPDEAAAAFTAALAADPHSAAARFYLGLARAQHNDRAGAAALWQSLLADTPDSAPLHQMLVDRIAMLTSQSGGTPAGGPRAMVAMLEARLKADPNDMPGWIRLVRAWHVLGDDAKARAAIAQGRKAFMGNAEAQLAFDTAQKDLKPD